MSLKDEILAASDTKLEAVVIPEWGVTVYVPVTILAEAEQLQKLTGGVDSFPQLAAFIIRDENGNRVFSEADAASLANKSLAAVKRIVDVYNRLNGNEGDSAAKN